MSVLKLRLKAESDLLTNGEIPSFSSPPSSFADVDVGFNSYGQHIPLPHDSPTGSLDFNVFKVNYTIVDDEIRREDQKRLQGEFT